MNMSSTPPVCQSCGQRPAEIRLVVSTNDGHENALLCGRCMHARARGGVPIDMGRVMRQIMALHGPGARPVTEPPLDDSSRQICDWALRAAAGTGAPVADAAHLAAAFTATPAGRGALETVGLSDNDVDALAAAVRGAGAPTEIPTAVASAPVPVYHPVSPSLKAAVQAAQHIAAAERARTTEPRHLWQGLTATADGAARVALREALGDRVPAGPAAPPKPTPVLDEFGRDLTALARDGKIDPVVGRDDEIEQLVEILARRRKNNAALIGEPGVGKTAIMEGLALQIANREVPDTMLDSRVVELDLGAMLAGTQFRGQFEERLKRALDELASSDGRIVLFVDELHTLIGAGNQEGQMDAANLLKPMLARGEIQMVGATTLSEYRRVEADGALARRFSPVYVQEPTVEETIDILRGLKDTYEAHHGVTVSDDAIVAAARLSDRYLHDTFQPDKALDLLDQAAARMRLRNVQRPEGIRTLETEIAGVEAEKERAVQAEEFERAARLKQRVDELAGRLARLRAERGAVGEDAATLREADIVDVVARRTGIPVGELEQADRDRLRDLEAELHEAVVGQDEAVTAVADIVRRARAGLHPGDGPAGSFLFLGPTGVGKTLLAKTLARRLFGTEDALLRLDMSEFREPHTVSRLIGAPPGYVGYGRGGQLTEPVRRRPYSVILLDEIEKAHPEVWNVLLQVLDDGRLTDGEGRTVDFSDTVIVMTSNLGAGKASGPVGFAADRGDARDRMLDAVRAAFPPELRNRIDETVCFHPLDEQHVLRVARNLVGELAERLRVERGVTLRVDEQLVARIAADGFDPEMGARPMQRHLRRTLERALVDAALEGALVEGAEVTASLDADGTVEVTAAAAARDEQPARTAA